MSRKLISMAVALVAFAMAGSARAGTLSYSSYAVIDPQTVTLSGPALGGQERAAAGEISLIGINGATGTLSTFCIDVADWLTPAGQFSTGSYLTGSLADQINALLTNVLPTLGTSQDASAALQVAIWKSEYGAGLTVSGDDGVTDLANHYIAQVQSGVWTANKAMQVAVLAGGGKDQSQAYLSPVSEPASLAVLGMALFCVAVLRYRRRAAGDVESAFAPPLAYSRLASISINCRPKRPPFN